MALTCLNLASPKVDSSFLMKLAISVQNSGLMTVAAGTWLLLLPRLKPQLSWQLIPGTILRTLHVCIPRILTSTQVVHDAVGVQFFVVQRNHVVPAEVLQVPSHFAILVATVGFCPFQTTGVLIAQSQPLLHVPEGWHGSVLASHGSRATLRTLQYYLSFYELNNNL